MSLEKAVLSTLTYHGIFDYPLTKEEIYKYQIGETASRKKIEKAIHSLVENKKIATKNNLYYLKGRGKIVNLRTRRKKYSFLKLKKARFFANILKLIPTVKLVAVSGALAMENAQKNDDIDLVIITARNTLWSTRLLANILLQPFRRKAGWPHIKNKACLNLFIEQSSLKIRTQNLYTAHEVAQMRPLWQRQNAYTSFLKANSWVKTFLPNWEPPSADSTFTFPHFLPPVLPLEALAKWGQLAYMKKKVTTEKIGKYQLFFHPRNTEELVLKEYIKRLNMLDNRYSRKGTSLQSSSSKTRLRV
ncbi:MAG: hypothetical protein Q7S45_02715 [Candidatus Curtissbacteria bacterium]|nr:hypothetical protein [Candidatus Curtissbacteria bacterium]